MEDKVKNTAVPDIFYNMGYGEYFEKTEDGIEWIKNKESTFFAYIDKPNESVNGTPVQIKNHINGKILCTEYFPNNDTVTKILVKCNSTVNWIDTKAFQRSKLINKLAEEISKNADVLSQIDIVCRGILGKDTRNKAVPLLAQYFKYYSNFAVKYDNENSSWKPEGVAVGVISNENVLSNIGLMLAPALASGYNIVLQVGTTLYPAAAFICELANKVGIPEEVIRVIPSDEGNLNPYFFSTNVAIVTLLVDLNKERYSGINNFSKKVLNLASNKTPAIIFDNADLDSASTNMIESAWGYQGLLPWSVNTILVQENIFDAFLNKLKMKIKETKVGPGNNRLVDISLISDDAIEEQKKLVKMAKNRGIEVFQKDESSNTFTPTMFIGGKVHTSRVLNAEEDQNANVVTVLAFRSIDEAVDLANNSRQGLAASVWTENVGIVNEVSRKLKVSNVWINSHGLTTPEITLSPVKDSGVGYFGGKEGFYEYVLFKKLVVPTNIVSESTHKLNGSCANFVNFAKKSQEAWVRLSKLNKGKFFTNFANYIENNRKSLSVSVSEKFLDRWVSEIYEGLTELNRSYSSTHLDFNIMSMREPLGVVAIENDADSELQNVRLIVAALVEGNAVILITNSPNSLAFYTELSTRLPSTIFTVLCYTLNNLQIIAAHNELGAYFGTGVNPIYRLLPIKDSKIYTNVNDSRDDVYNKVTFPKNVWSNIGKSCTCNLSSY